MPENRTVWKSNNQGVKAETFDQTCRRGEERMCGKKAADGPIEVVAGEADGPTCDKPGR